VGRDRQNYLDYLSRLGQTEADYRATLAESAERRVRRSIVLGALTDAEAIEVTDADVEAELDDLVAPAGDDAGRLRELFATGEGRATIRRNLITDRTLRRLREIAASDEPAVAPENRTATEAQTAEENTPKDEVSE
jgi:trigger factor